MQPLKEALKNPHRRKILELLASRKSMTPREIAEELHIGVPTVYYHLEVLGDHVQKTGKGEFSATEKGLEVYRAEIVNATPKSPGISIIYSSVYLLVARPLLALLLGVVAMVIELAACYGMGFAPFMLGYRPVLDASSLPVYYVASIAFAFVTLEVASYALNRRLGGEAPLLAGLLLSRLPLLLFFALPFARVDDLVVGIAVAALAQLLSIFVLSTFLSLSKGLRQEVSIILCLLLLYLYLLVNSSVQF
ncbi:MAG: helix-turn-helix domain-containing protein [Candidatus Verstraetearchaeota archaeon]|nr:helix-turn-helix domain-containing protein [Candidatus Verstraetearchaeota archaeon]